MKFWKKWRTGKAKLFKTEHGQSLVELSLGLLVLIILLSGVVDLGRILMFTINLRDAAQEGSQYASIYPSDCVGIINRINSAGQDYFSPASVMVDVKVNGKSCASATTSDACFGKNVAVSITHPDFPITMPFLGTILGKQTISLTSNSNSTILRPPCP